MQMDTVTHDWRAACLMLKFTRAVKLYIPLLGAVNVPENASNEGGPLAKWPGFSCKEESEVTGSRGYIYTGTCKYLRHKLLFSLSTWKHG